MNTIKAGDFVEVIDSQAGFVGLSCECIYQVSEVDPSLPNHVALRGREGTLYSKGYFKKVEAPAKKSALVDSQIKHMVQRFLGWKLPTDFVPDNYISFTPAEYQKTGANAYALWPTGTNLFTAAQAEAMIRYLTEGLNPMITTEQQHVWIDYTNHRLERSICEIIPCRIVFYR